MEWSNPINPNNLGSVEQKGIGIIQKNKEDIIEAVVGQKELE